MASTGTVPPNSADGLALKRGAIESDSFLSWGHRYCERSFLRKIFYWMGERSCVSI